MCCFLFSLVVVLSALSFAESTIAWDKYPACQAKRQSPIDIIDDDTKMDKKLEIVTSNWSKDNVKMNVTNKAKTIQVNIIDAAANAVTTTFENQTYEPVQFHFHWGTKSFGAGVDGSEHLVNGKSYPAELHIVHYNKKYSDINNALQYGDGLLVVGVFIKSGKTNEAMADITSHLHKVSTVCKGNELVSCKGGRAVHLKLSQLVPKDGLQAFYHYDGSLTTPPCSEAVNWIVMRTPIEMDESQFSEFRSLHGTESGAQKTKYMSGNFREPQKLWGRTVTRNFVPKAEEEKEEDQEASSSSSAVLPSVFVGIIAIVATLKAFA